MVRQTAKGTISKIFDTLVFGRTLKKSFAGRLPVIRLIAAKIGSSWFVEASNKSLLCDVNYAF
jgi:hypothetical protein